MGFTDKESVESYFSAAKGYDRRMRFQVMPLMFRTTFGSYAGTMKSMLSGFTGCRVLDIACGTGLCGTVLDPSNSYTGLDISPPMLAETKRRLDSYFISFAAVEGDATALPFRDAAFDLVVSSLGLHFVPDITEAIAEVARVMKPGGIFACSSPVMESGFISDRYWRYYHKKGRYNAPIYERDLAGACKAAGLDYVFYAKKGRLLYFTAEKR